MLRRHSAREGGILSLAQGIVHWSPPEEAMAAALRAMSDRDTSSYCPDDGYLPLCDALKAKLEAENGLKQSEVMVTQGANQAYMNTVLTLLDQGDKAVLFSPFYFNHQMALQLANASIELGKVDEDLLPDMQWFEGALQKGARDGEPIKMVTLTSPCNPTGVHVPPETVKRCAALCEQHGAWLVVDNTYEHFTYGRVHHAPEADHIVNVFSFSKGFGMMGWRVGYLAYPPRLRHEMLKSQDTIAICPTVMSQKVAIGALEAGRDWVLERVGALEESKALVRNALEPLGTANVLGGSGAIYMMARLGEGVNDAEVVEWLVAKHGVCTIPGSACGAPGFIRVCYANLADEDCKQAAERLHIGLRELCEHGMRY